MAAKGSARVVELKDKGNECVKAGNFAEAIIHYTFAIKLDSSQYQLYSNRSFAFLKLQQYFYALEDAKETIRLQPDWAKGYYRKAEVEFQVERFEDALESYRKAFQLQPDKESGLLEAIQKTKLELEKFHKAEAQIPWVGAGLGLILGTIIVIGDHIASKEPVMKHPLLKVLLVFAVSGVGYFLARLYRYYLAQQRFSLLEPPIDLLGDEKEKTEQSKNEEIKSEEKHRTNKATARQRYKKGKS